MGFEAFFTLFRSKLTADNDMKRFLSSLALAWWILCLATLSVAPADQGSDNDGVVIRVVSPSADTTSFKALFQTGEEVLISEESRTTPATYEIAEENFSGVVRPAGDGLIAVTATRGTLSSSRSSMDPIRVVVSEGQVSLSTVKSDDE